MEVGERGGPGTLVWVEGQAGALAGPGCCLGVQPPGSATEVSILGGSGRRSRLETWSTVARRPLKPFIPGESGQGPCQGLDSNTLGQNHIRFISLDTWDQSREDRMLTLKKPTLDLCSRVARNCSDP